MSQGSSGTASALLRIGCFVGACVGVACALRARLRKPQRPQFPRRGSSLSLLYKLMDLGGFFGVDIGGTLAKVVFFLPDKELATRMLVRLASQRSRQAEWHAKLRSVHQLAGFILSNDRYGATGVRDGDLAIDLPELGGSFHFIRFETRRMQGALRLAAKHGLGAGMHRICTTGGGAHKVRARVCVGLRRQALRATGRALSIARPTFTLSFSRPPFLPRTHPPSSGKPQRTP